MFGVAKAVIKKRCGYWKCRNLAEYYIGDKDKPFLRTNMFVCEEHLKGVADDLNEMYGNSKTEVANENTNAKDKVLSVLLEKTGKISKAELAEIYTEVTGETPGEELTFKVLLTKLFPELEK